MTVATMISGSIFRAPTQKTSKTGKPFTVAPVKVAADNEQQFWNLLAFGESVRATLLRLSEGDKLSVQDSLNLEVFVRTDGDHKISRTPIADHILALRQPPRERRPKAPGRREASASEPREAAPPPFDDGLPEGWQ